MKKSDDPTWVKLREINKVRYKMVPMGGADSLISFLATALVTKTFKIPSGLTVERVPLRRNDDDSPWCFAASSSIHTMLEEEDETTTTTTTKFNFLATQVWPSARYAAETLESIVPKEWCVCELGCGPGMPSLTLAKAGVSNVIATDIDEVALEMVQLASNHQNLLSNLSTQQYDLCDNHSEIFPHVDLYIMSDVFESSHVAKGAAKLTQRILSSTENSNIWVFAQSDRAQREVYLKSLKDMPDVMKLFPDLGWKKDSLPSINNDAIMTLPRLVLFDIDETKVSYF